MLATVVLLPAAVAALSALFGWRRWVAWAGVATGVGVLGGGIAVAVRVLGDGAITEGGILRADALSAWMVIVIGAITLLANLFAVGYLGAELDQGHTDPSAARTYGALVHAFEAAMLLAVLAANVGVMWVAVEGTTLATAFLVGHRRSRGSLEASWKYVVIGSVGIALAFLGTILVSYAAQQAGGGAEQSLDWATLVSVAPRLDPGVMRIAVALLVLGYGTKVGLAPMHTWLPDAHSQAPAPVSALMSGVLLSVAFYALLRFKVIADAALGPGFMRGLLVAVSLLSLLVSASLLLAQRDYKRMLAYSSIEHMGLISLGAAAGSPLAITGVLLHIFGHGLAKSVLFLASGEMLLTEGSTRIDRVRALLARRPVLGGSFGLGLLALLGFPPFSLFVSELTMIRAEIAAGLVWAVAVQVVLMLVIFIALLDHGRHMLLGAADPGDQAPIRTRPIAAVPLVAGLVACAALGVTVWPAEQLLQRAAALVGA